MSDIGTTILVAGAVLLTFMVTLGDVCNQHFPTSQELSQACVKSELISLNTRAKELFEEVSNNGTNKGDKN